MTLPYCRQLSISAALLLLSFSPHALGTEADITVPSKARNLMLSMPKPQYPVEARLRRHMGRGMFDIIFQVKSGAVTQVKILQSTGSKLLDDAAVKAFSRWRARPGMISHIKVPVTFVM